MGVLDEVVHVIEWILWGFGEGFFGFIEQKISKNGQNYLCEDCYK